MKNFQAVIDAAFGALPVAKRALQTPSAAGKERDLAFAAQAKKIDALRQMRLAAPEEQPASLVFEIVRYRGHWRTLHCSKHSSPFSDQAAAILAAKKLAAKKRSMGHSVEVVLRRTDGETVRQPLDDEPNE